MSLDTTAKATPEAMSRLAASVLMQAWEDAQIEPVGGFLDPQSYLDAIQAIAFLTDASGESARSRETWCDMAGILPEAVLNSAKLVLTPELRQRQADAYKATLHLRNEAREGRKAARIAKLLAAIAEHDTKREKSAEEKDAERNKKNAAKRAKRVAGKAAYLANRARSHEIRLAQ